MAAPKKNQPTAKQIASSSSKPTSLNLDNDGDFLPDLIKEINKEAGSKILFNLGANDAPTIVHRWISTGSKQLDYIIGNLPGIGGGLPEGRIVEIQGPTGCGKSHVMFEIAKATQRLGGLVIYVDTENATSIDNLEKIGINVKKRFAFAQTSCTEDIFGLIEKTILKARTMAADIPVTVIWDSVANSSPKPELEGEYDQNTIGLQARVLGKGLRKITYIIAGQHVLLVCCQQQREKIGCVSPETILEFRQVENKQMQTGTIAALFEKMGFDYKTMEINQPIVPTGVWEVKTLNKQGTETWKKVTKIVRKNIAKKLILRTEKHELFCSPDHKVLVKQQGQEEPFFEEVAVLFGNEDNFLLRTIEGWLPFHVELSEENTEILDLEVEDEHSYLSNGIVSHNTIYGDPITTPGGKALPYASSVRIKIGSPTPLKKMVDGKERVYGVGVTAKVIKNRMSNPFREVEFEIHFGKGIREQEQVFDYLRDWCTRHEKNPVVVNGQQVLVEGTGAWKTFTLTDVKTNLVTKEVKFYKPDFGEKVLYNPEYAKEMAALMDAAYIMQTGDTDHLSFAGVDSNSVEEMEEASGKNDTHTEE